MDYDNKSVHTDTGAKKSRIRHELHSLKKVSVLSEPVSFQKLVDALVECENLQVRAIQEVALHANLVEGAPRKH
ncbi:hypothetical protein V6Z12_A08G144000 [Gossypium hirsutum]